LPLKQFRQLRRASSRLDVHAKREVASDEALQAFRVSFYRAVLTRSMTAAADAALTLGDGEIGAPAVVSLDGALYESTTDALMPP